MKTMLRTVCVLLLFSLLLLLPVNAGGEDAVSVPGGEATDMESLKAALGGEVYVKDKTVTMKRDLRLDAPLVLSGGDYILNGAGGTLYRGKAEGDLIVLKDGAKLLLGKEKREGSDILLTVDGEGNDKGRLFRVTGEAVLTMNAGVVVTGGGAGGILCEKNGVFQMKDGLVSACRAEEGGGILVREDGVFTIEGGTVTSCEAKRGGNIAVIGGSAGLAGGTVTDGLATEMGGGCYLDGTVLFGAVSITLCHAEKGGGIYVVSCPEIGSGSVTENTATYGGGVYTASESFSIAKLGIESNTAEQGGGLYNEKNISLGDVYIDKNIALNRGGGVYNAGTMELHGAMIANNEGSLAAGLWNEGTLISDSCSVMTNRGEIGTGAVNNGVMTLIGNSFFSPRNVLCVAVNAGEGKGSVTFRDLLSGAEMPCFAPVSVAEDGEVRYEYSTRAPLVLGEAADVERVSAGALVRADGAKEYILTPEGCLKRKMSPVPFIAGGAAVVAAVGIAAVLVIKKKKKA